MEIGLIGAGNMARAMARGWGRPVLCFDPLRERARALVAELGGSVLGSNAELAERAELVVLCHKPAQLEQVASEVAPAARAVASILANTSIATLAKTYGHKPVFRFLPALPAEVRAGAIVQGLDRAYEHELRQRLAGDDAASERYEACANRVKALFAELGTLVELDDGLVDVAMGLMSCAPAYIALISEAQVDAGVRRGLPAPQASALVTETLAGTAELLRKRNYDTLTVRREVTSPGGTTARGLNALEQGGVRSAFSDALDAVLGKAR